MCYHRPELEKRAPLLRPGESQQANPISAATPAHRTDQWISTSCWADPGDTLLWYLKPNPAIWSPIAMAALTANTIAPSRFRFGVFMASFPPNNKLHSSAIAISLGLHGHSEEMRIIQELKAVRDGFFYRPEFKEGLHLLGYAVRGVVAFHFDGDVQFVTHTLFSCQSRSIGGLTPRLTSRRRGGRSSAGMVTEPEKGGRRLVAAPSFGGVLLCPLKYRLSRKITAVSQMTKITRSRASVSASAQRK